MKHQDYRAIKSMEKKELLLVNLIDEFFTFCPDKAQGCVIDGDSELLGKRLFVVDTLVL